MKIVIDIQDEDVLFDISKHNLSPTSQTDGVIINALYDGKPIEDDRPTLIYKGQVVYLTDEHIQAMAEWEKEEMKKEVLEQFKKTIDGLSDFDFDWQSEMRKDYSDVIADLKGKSISGTVYQDSFCPHAHNCIEYFGSHCADRCPLKKESKE